MFLNDPQTEGVIHWLAHLALGVFRPSKALDIAEELKVISPQLDSDLCQDLRKMVDEGRA